MSRRAPQLSDLEAVCDRWAGLHPGAEIPCRSTIVGRTLEVKVRGHGPKTTVKVTGCRVPRSTRPSKRCKPDYRVEEVGSLVPFHATVDGGTIRNAARTPRPTHPGGPFEFSHGRFNPGPVDFIEMNRAEGLALMTGLDVPYPHRAGSAICCPDHAANALRLRGELMDTDAEGEPIAPSTRRGLARLAKHLIEKHRATVASSYGPDDYADAYELVTVGDQQCAAELSAWQENQVERQALYREEKRRKAKAAKSRKASAAKSRKTQVRRAHAKHQKYEATQQRRTQAAASAEIARLNSKLKRAA